MKTLKNTLILFLFMLIIFALMFLIPVEKGHYVPDCIEDGVLIDTDGDGDYYHWVEP